jgi:hypothetical protein
MRLGLVAKNLSIFTKTIDGLPIRIPYAWSDANAIKI